jgi:hypothetical protein
MVMDRKKEILQELTYKFIAAKNLMIRNQTMERSMMAPETKEEFKESGSKSIVHEGVIKCPFIFIVPKVGDQVASFKKQKRGENLKIAQRGRKHKQKLPLHKVKGGSQNIRGPGCLGPDEPAPRSRRVSPEAPPKELPAFHWH